MSEGIRAEPGGEGLGLFVRAGMHRASTIRINSVKGQNLMKKGENQGATLKVEVRGRDLLFEVPKTSASSYELTTGTGWVRRPYAVRSVEMVSALGTGKHTRPADGEYLERFELARGLASRQCIPVMQFTGDDNGVTQEFALLVR